MQNFTNTISVTETKKTFNVFYRSMMITMAAIFALMFSFNASSQTTLINPAGDGGFELGGTLTANGWIATTGQTNKWFVGTVAVPSTGTNSAFISSSATGTTYDYDINSASVSHIYKDFTVPPGQSIASLSFKWKSAGESCCDYLRVWLFPTSFTPTAGTQVSGGTQLGGNLNANTIYQTANFSSGLIPGTSYRLIFEWRNDGSLGPSPAASIDDVSLVVAAPSNFTASSLGGLWSSPATWVGGVVPASGNSISIPAGSVVTVDQGTSYGNLDISGTVQWNSSSNAMTLSGNLTISSGGTFLPYTTGQTGQTINIGGNFANNGYANLAQSGTLVNFNGSGSTLSGTGVFQGNGTDGIIRTLAFQNLGSNSISTSQNIITSALTHTGGSLSTGGKLKIDNTAKVYGLPLNLQVANVVVTSMGSNYSAAPVVFGGVVTQYASGLSASTNTRYVAGNNVYLCTNAGLFNATVPTSTSNSTFTTSGPTLLYIGTVGTLGNPYQVTSVTAGSQYFYNGNLYTCTVSGVPGAAGVPPTHTSGTATSGAATFLYVGTAATATVNYDATTQTVRSLALTSGGSGYVSAPSISFSVGVAGGTGSGASATAVYIQQIAGPTNSLTTKSGGGATISGTITINSDQGASIASVNPQASSGVGAISTSNGGMNYTVAPVVGFALPPALNLITNAGSGYTSTPTVTVTGGNLVTGSALTTSNFTITVNQGIVESVYLNTGTSATYSTLPTLTLTTSPGVTATLEFPAGCLPTATADIGANRQLTSFTITNAGFGYVIAPTAGIGTSSGTVNGGTFTTVASAPTARIALYNLTLNLTAPTTTAIVSADDAAIPTNRKMNNLTLGGNANGLNLNSDLTLFGSSPLSLTSSSATPGNVLDLGGNNLNFTWNAYAGTTGTFSTTNTYIKNGSMSVTGRGGASTFNFPFAGTFNWFAGSTPTSVTTGSTVTRVTVTESAAPTGAGALGTRAFLVNNGGGTQGLNPTVTMNYNTVDALPTGTNATDLFISQATALSGAWAPRSAASGSGTVGTSGVRTTATVAPGPLVPTGSDYFAWTAVTLDFTNVTVDPSTCLATAHLVSADVTTSLGTITGVTITYNNGTATGPVAMTNTAGSTWQFTIPAASPSNSLVTWSITATNSAGISKTYTGSSYQDDALNGVTATASASTNTSCSGSPVVLTAIASKPGSVVLGAGASTSGSSGSSFFPGSWGGAKTQYLVKASELTALGLAAGDITSLAFETTTAAFTYTGFNVNIGHTAVTAMTTPLLSTPMTQIYRGTGANDGFACALGVNTLTFGTGAGSSSSFNWDGTSNIVISICWSTVPNASSTTTTTMKVDAPGFTCTAYGLSDNVAPATLCSLVSGFGTSSTGTSRPKFTFVGNFAPAISSFTWNDGTSDIGTGNPLTVNPTANTTYTATGTTASGCTVTSPGVAVNILTLPTAPGANNSNQCGTGVPDCFVTSGGGGAGFKWYDAEFNGNLLQTGGATYLGSISTTTIFWVSESDGTCESLRTPVTQTVNAPDPVSASSNGPVCSNSSLQLTATVTGNTNGNTYSYDWTASPAIGSGIPTNQSGGSGTFGTPASISVTPTASGTYTYTATGTDGDCVAVATVVVNIKALPVITTTIATPSTICAGASVNLSASTIDIGAGLANSLGTDVTLTSATSQPTAFCNRWPSYRMQTIYTAAELQAVGLSAGNITSMAFDITTLGDGATNSGFTVKIAPTAQVSFVGATDFTSTVSGFTTVFPSQTYTHTATGLQTLPFSTPFVWDGTSNIIVEVIHNGANSINNSTTRYTATAVNMVAYTTTASNNTASFSTQRLNVVFGGQVAANGPGSLNWSWNPGALSGNSVTVNPASTTTYTVSATDPATTCSNTGTVTVTVNPLPPAPSGNNGQDQCGTAFTDASVSSNNGIDPQSPPFFNWYLVPTGGTAVQSGTSTTFETEISSTTNFYVSEVSLNGCEGPRVAISTTVAEPDALTVSATSTTICLGATFDISSSYTANFNSFATFDLTATGGVESGVNGVVSLTPNATGSDAYSVTPTSSGTYIYTITANDPDKGCTSIGTVTVTVNANPLISGVSASATEVCAGAPVTLSAVSISPGTGSAAVGAGSGTSNSSGTPFYGSWGGTKVQYIYTAAELTAAGILPGNITSIGLNVTVAGATAYQGFAINIGGTAQSVFATANTVTSVTQVYSGPLANSGYLPTVGLNTFTFTSPFNWNGTDNIAVSFCYSNNNGSNPASTIQTDTYTGFNRGMYIYADNQTFATVCGATTTIPASGGSATTTLRPKTTFSGQVALNNTANFSWSWNPGSLSGASVTVNPTTTTTYTATATANGCSTNSDPVTVTVNPLPALPVTNSPVTRCGPGSVTLTATGSGGTLNWFNVASGGTSVYTGGSYTLNVTASTSFWVAETSAFGCIGPRSEVTVTVSTPPTLAITPATATSFCEGGSVGLDAATASDPGYVNFAWTVSPSVGAGLSSASGAAITSTPTAGGTYTITVTANDGAPNGCSNTSTINVTMNPNPVITSVMAAPATICNGGNSTLVGSSINALTGTATVGAGAITSTTYPAAFYSLWSNKHEQIMIKASELTAAGLATGNITSLSFPTTSGTLSPLDFSVKLAQTNATDMSAFLTSGLTQVYFAATQPQVANTNNTLTLSAPYNWDGISNLVIDICFGNAASSATMSCTSPADNTSYVSVIKTHTSAATAAATACSDITSQVLTYTVRPKILIGGQVGTDVTNTLNWVWNPGAISGSVVSVTPATTTSYSVTATNPATGCSTSSTTPVTVTVTPVGSNATASPSTPVCVGTAVLLNANATGGAPFTYAWSDGTAAVYPATATITVNPTVTTSYTVTVTDACSNPTSSSVSVTVNPLPTAGISESGPITLCAPATQVLTAVTDAASPGYQWTLDGVNIPSANGATYTVNTVSTGTYRVVVTNTITGCLSAPSTGVVVTINPQPGAVTITPAAETICNGGSSTLVASGGTSGGSGNATIGNAATLTSATSQPTAFCNRWPSYRMQTVYTAAELTSAGMSAGSITSMTYNISTLGDAATNANFVVKIGTTASSVLSGDFVSTTAFTTVYPSQTYTHTASGLQTIPFSTPFVWNGTSNIIVEVIHSGADNFNNSQTYYTATPGNTVAYTTTASTNTASFSNQRLNVTFGYSSLQVPTWSWLPSTGLNATTGATVIASPSGTTTYTATATNTFGCTNSVVSTATVTVNPRPTGVISGGASYCAGSVLPTQLSIAVTGTGPWSGTLSNGQAFSGSSSPILVNVTPSPEQTTTYTIAALTDGLCASIGDDLSGSATVTVNPLAANPTATVLQPTCVLGTGTITVTSPLGVGTTYSLDGGTFQSSVTFTGVAPGVHSLAVNTNSGCFSPASTSVTVDPQPFTPSAPVITGTVNVCPYIGTLEQITYTATAAGATGYTWSLPPNVSVVSGAGTGTLVVTFANGFAAQANKQIRVTANSICGTSAQTIYYLLTQYPITPSPITGATNVCTLIGTAATATYSIPASPGAVSYVWSVPAGAVITPAPLPTALSIDVVFNSGFAGGPISVTAVNGCGTSGTRTLNIVNTPASTPSLISGPTNVCPHIAPGGTAATYSIAPVSFATSYNWTVPAGVTDLTGQGTTSISFTYPAGFVSGSLSVTATNGCGTSAPRAQAVNKLNPAAPSNIDVIQQSFCGDAGDRTFSYTLAAMPANATSVTWTIPASATILSGLGTSSILVSYPNTSVSGTVTAQAINNCGVSTIRSTTVKLPACPPPAFTGTNNGNNTTGLSKGEVVLATSDKMEVKIFPNPTVSDFKMEVLTSGKELINVRVLDGQGRLFKTFRVMPNQVIALGAELRAGSYLIEVRQGTEVKTTKVIKF